MRSLSKVFEKIEALKYDSGGVKAEVKKLVILEGYVRNNIDGIISYKERIGVSIPNPPPGLEYRNMGTMERNINIFVKRMKGGMSWSEAGGSNLSKIIAL
ncbi:MAG TPA: ISLre2 family transposase, partial [Ruminiclostridium sp.]